MEELRTPHAVEKEAREMEIYREFKNLSSIPGAMKTQVAKIINEKYKLRSTATLHQIRKRVESKLSTQGGSLSA
ncbi:hypothetical protein [Dyadobacter sp. CY312]|uniref:hypothetical protein n=1 Tax=Dyadobacter sp. CY312 TaxID=2907303 RepID=UPI001F36778C|nr:hypothetical protein [Dyadobacter sp. CY312]MCE7038973.1 hypothetical protein [Dyadobacter sp. CY312]